MKQMFRQAMLFLATAAVAVPALAQEGGKTELAHVFGSAGGWVALAAGICMGLAALGGTLGQSKASAAFMDGVARNPAAQPKMFIPLILSLALMESLVLFGFLVANKMGGIVEAALKTLGMAG